MYRVVLGCTMLNIVRYGLMRCALLTMSFCAVGTELCCILLCVVPRRIVPRILPLIGFLSHFLSVHCAAVQAKKKSVYAIEKPLQMCVPVRVAGFASAFTGSQPRQLRLSRARSAAAAPLTPRQLPLVTSSPHTGLTPNLSRCLTAVKSPAA